MLASDRPLSQPLALYFLSHLTPALDSLISWLTSRFGGAIGAAASLATSLILSALALIDRLMK